MTTHGGSAGSTKLVDTVSGEDSYITSQAFAVDIGIPLTVTAWLNCTAFTAGAVGNRGIYLTANPTNWSSITAVTSGWVLQTVTMTPTASPMSIRLYAPQATVFWDDVFFDDGLGASRYQPAQMRGVLTHA